MFKQNILEALLFSVALSVGLVPELLPMMLSVNLSKGAMAMSRKGVIVKRLASIQDLGSMDVLCTDKTGTLVGVDEYDLQTSAFEGLGFSCETVVLARSVASLTIHLYARMILPIVGGSKAFPKHSCAVLKN